MKASFIVLACLCLSLLAAGQTYSPPPNDTILLNSGRIVVTQVTDTIGEAITVIKPGSKKHKKAEIQKEAIFSVKWGSTGKEEIFYIYDTLTEHDYQVADARKFIEGEQDASKGFHPYGASVMALAIGISSGASFGLPIAFGPPFLFGGLMTYPRIKVRHKSVRNLENGKSDAYLMGYDMTARRKRTLHTFLWGAVGMVIGVFIHSTVANGQ